MVKSRANISQFLFIMFQANTTPKQYLELGDTVAKVIAQLNPNPKPKPNWG